MTDRLLRGALEILDLSAVIFRGGPGSGHFGHKGRPGEVGGSAPGMGGLSTGESGKTYPVKWTPTGRGVGAGVSHESDDGRFVIHGTGAGHGMNYVLQDKNASKPDEAAGRFATLAEAKDAAQRIANETEGYTTGEATGKYPANFNPETGLYKNKVIYVRKSNSHKWFWVNIANDQADVDRLMPGILRDYKTAEGRQWQIKVVDVEWEGGDVSKIPYSLTGPELERFASKGLSTGEPAGDYGRREVVKVNLGTLNGKRVYIEHPLRTSTEEGNWPNDTLHVGGSSILLDTQRMTESLYRLMPAAYMAGNGKPASEWRWFIDEARRRGLLRG